MLELDVRVVEMPELVADELIILLELVAEELIILFETEVVLLLGIAVAVERAGSAAAAVVDEPSCV